MPSDDELGQPVGQHGNDCHLTNLAIPLGERVEVGHPTEDTPDHIRQAARGRGVEVAMKLNSYWNTARTSPEGPIEIIDMFSGCGGMSSGFLAVNGLFAAYRHALAVDIDGVANATYHANLGLKPLQEDISQLAREKKRFLDIVHKATRAGHPMVLIGCAPCQGFSSHRNRGGDADPRNSLFMDFVRVASILRPTAIVIENVPELLTIRYWPYVEAARRALWRSGYYVHLGVHNMAEFGTPQDRFRAVLLALPKRFLPPSGFLERRAFQTVREAIGRLPAVRAGERVPEDPMHYSAGHKESTLATIRAVPKDGGDRSVEHEPDCLRRVKERQGRAAYEDVYGRLWWDKPAITITAYGRNPASGRFVHPQQDRGLTVREAALLQGFPKDYWFAGSLDERFRQIGNAVPPNFAAYLALHVLGELLAPEPTRDKYDVGLMQPVGTSFSRLIPALKAGHRTVGVSKVSL